MKQFLKNEMFAKVRNRLARLVTDDQEARSITRLAGLDSTQIELRGNPLIMSDAILSRAELEGKVLDLLEACINNFNGDAELEAFQQQIAEAFYVLEANGMPVGASEAINILLIYARADKKYVKELLKQLHILAINGDAIVTNMSFEITEGVISTQEKGLISSSNIVLPLLSPNFFSENTNHLTNMRFAFNAGKIVVPILLLDCLYGRIDVLNDIVKIPDDGSFISNKPSMNKAFYDVAQWVAHIIDTKFKNNHGYVSR